MRTNHWMPWALVLQSYFLVMPRITVKAGLVRPGGTYFSATPSGLAIGVGIALIVLFIGLWTVRLVVPAGGGWRQYLYHALPVTLLESAFVWMVWFPARYDYLAFHETLGLASLAFMLWIFRSSKPSTGS